MKLSAKQRKQLLSGKHPEFELACREDCPEGEVVLERFGRTPIVTLKWTGPVKDHGRFLASYRLVDLRPERLLRTSPPATRFRRGARSAPTADALDQAAEESGYTRNPVQAMAQEPEAVPKAYQDRLSREAGASNAIKREVERVRVEKLRLERRLRDARKQGATRTVRTLMRRLNSANRDLDRAA